MTEMRPKHTEVHKPIIDRCRNNDHKAQFELYTIYHQAIYNTCLRILKNKGLSEDVMQETFITAFDKIGSFKGEATFGAWLKRIAVNKSIDALRKNPLIFQPLDETIPEHLLVDNTDNIKLTKGEYEISHKIELIKKGLAFLPDGYRIVLSLYLFEGYDHEEISQILNITESSSRSQFTRAKQKLLDILYQKFGMRNDR